MRVFSLALITMLVGASTACGDRPSPLAPTGKDSPGTNAAQSRPTDVDVSFTGEGFCTFAVLFHFTGKTKTIELPGPRTIITAPKAVATLTNLDNQQQETFGITGAFHQETLTNGDLVTVVTGRNLLFDPIAGLVLAIGRFSFVFDAQGNLIQPLQGKGQLIDVCDLLS
jgi:hypothetical protein